jgi:hypothetical protein
MSTTRFKGISNVYGSDIPDTLTGLARQLDHWRAAGARNLVIPVQLSQGVIDIYDGQKAWSLW